MISARHSIVSTTRSSFNGFNTRSASIDRITMDHVVLQRSLVSGSLQRHRRRLHGARGARAPLNLRAQGPIIRLSPPIFCHTKFNFYVLFLQVNATATRFTQCHMIFSKFIELNKFSQSFFNYVGYSISPTFKCFNFNFILHTNCLPTNFIF